MLGNLIKLLEKDSRTEEENETIRLETGDGIVAAIESSQQIGSSVVGLEPEKGYTISTSDWEPGCMGVLLKGFDKWWETNLYNKCHRKGELDPSIYQSSFILPVVERIQRWIWKKAWYPAYKTASLDREQAYAQRLIKLEQEKSVKINRPPRIYFFIGAGHKWNTEKLIKEIQGP